MNKNIIDDIKKNSDKLKKNNNDKDKNINLNEEIDCLKNELVAKNSEIDILNKKIFDIEKKIYDIKLRCQADIDNIHKRNKIEMENVYKYSLEKFIYDILPVIDNLRSALKNINNNIKLSDKNKYINITYDGIKLTLKNFIFVLKKYGVSIIKEKNIIFDPNYHQAMIVVDSDDKSKENLIIDILQEGYLINNRLIRPAMVKVYRYINKSKN